MSLVRPRQRQLIAHANLAARARPSERRGRLFTQTLLDTYFESINQHFHNKTKLLLKGPGLPILSPRLAHLDNLDICTQLLRTSLPASRISVKPWTFKCATIYWSRFPVLFCWHNYQQGSRNSDYCNRLISHTQPWRHSQYKHSSMPSIHHLLEPTILAKS